MPELLARSLQVITIRFSGNSYTFQIPWISIHELGRS